LVRSRERNRSGSNIAAKRRSRHEANFQNEAEIQMNEIEPGSNTARYQQRKRNSLKGGVENCGGL